MAEIPPRADGYLGDQLYVSAVTGSIANLGYKHAFEIPYIATADYTCTSISNGASIPITELAFEYEKDSTYLLDGMLLYQSSLATLGVRFALDCSTSITTATLAGVAPLTAAGAVTGFLAQGDLVYSCPTTAVAVVNKTYPAIINGLLITGDYAGTCTLRFKPESVAKTKVVLKKYSVLTIRKVG